MKKRVLAVLLALTLLVSMSTTAVFATEEETALTLESILGFSAVKSDLKVTFDENFDSEATGYKAQAVNLGTRGALGETALCEGFAIDDSSGEMALKVVNPTIEGKYPAFGWGIGNPPGWNPLSTTSAIRFRAKLTEGASLGVLINRTRTNITLSENSISMLGGTNGNKNIKVAPGTEWNTYLVTTDGTGYSLYIQLDDGKWSHVHTCDAFQDGKGDWGVVFNVGAGQTAYVDYVETLIEETAFPLESILGVKAVKTDLKVNFDENFDSESTGYKAQAVDLGTREALGETALCEGFAIDDSSGEMALKVVNPTIEGKSPAFGWGIGASPGWNPLSATSAIRFRAKLTEGASLNVMINRTRTNITLSENSISMLGGTNGNKNIKVAPGTEWNSYLVTTDGIGYSLYIQLDDGRWNHVHTCDAFQDGKGNWGVVFGVGAGQTAYVDYVETLMEETEFPLESILGVNAVKTDLRVNFDENFDSEATGYKAQAVDLGTRGALGETALCEGFAIDDSSGEMALKVVNPTIEGKYPAFGWGIGASPGWNPLNATTAVRFRAKLTEGASLNVMINRNRTNITLSENSISMLGGTNGNKNIKVAPGTEWNTYLVTTDGTGYSLYIQLDNGKWSRVHNCDAFQENKGDWGVVFGVGAGQTAYVDYVETLIEEIPLPLESILGVNAVKTDLKVTFDENFDSESTGYKAQAVDLGTREALGETALCEGFDIDDSSGEMALKVVSPTIEGKTPAFGWGIGSKPGWNPLSPTKAVRFRAKLTEGASLGVRINRTRTNITLSENSISMLGGTNGNKNIKVAPGTEWNTYLVTTDGTGYSLYIQLADGTWKRVHTCDAFQDGKGDWGVVFGVGAGQTAYVGYVETLIEDSSISTEELLGANVVTTNYVKFDSEYKENGNKLEMTQEQSAYNYTTAVMGEQYMELEGTEWSFGKALTATDTNVTFGLDKPIELRVKLPENGKLSIQGPHTVRGGGRYYIELTPDRTRAYGGDGVKKSGYDKVFDASGIGTEWTTLLLKLIPNEQAVTKPSDETSVSATIPPYSYEIYVKDDESQRWTKAVTTIGLRGDNCYQLSLSGGEAGSPILIDYIKFYDIDGAVDETITKPETANILYYSEEFSATPDAANISMGSGATVVDNALELSTDASDEGIFDVNQTEIPVGGYAEFKFKSSAKTELIFAGTTKEGGENLSIQFDKLTGGYHNSDKKTLGANEANIWHTYRLVRVNESGYHLYKKTEGDANWQIDLENMSTKGRESDYVATKLVQFAKEDGSAAKAQFEYLKIYGPAGEEKLIVTDGITTLKPADAASLNYPNQLRAMVNGAGGRSQLIFAGYAGNSLVKMELHDVADLENGESIFNATNTPKAITKVKVFLWDGFASLAPVSQARNFGVSQ